MNLDQWVNQVHCMDCLEGMRQLPDGCVHCCVTSPPYYGLRDYGIEGQIGLEKTPEEYIEKLVLVFREVWRVMHPTGSLYLDMGDSYNGSGGEHKHDKGQSGLTDNRDKVGFVPGRNFSNYKPKDLMEIPSDLVRALRTDGWWLRARIPWLKRNAMPESVTDRPTQAVEYVFLLSKSASYFYDGEAVRVKAISPDSGTGRRTYSKVGLRSKFWGTHDMSNQTHRSRRNSDWFFESWQGLWTDENGDPLALIVNPKPFKGAHFATFPPGLVIPCLKAGTSEKGCCPECGNPWVRVVETSGGTIGKSWHDHKKDLAKGQRVEDIRMADGTYKRKTLGWRPTCSCGKEPVPCVVLDPFMGVGTVAQVAKRMGRGYVGFEISKEYIEIGEPGLAQEVLL